MDPVSRTLRDSMVDGYVPFVHARLAEFELDAPDGMEPALAEGRRWLADALDALLGRPFSDQPRSPLEIFQEAMRFPTEALEAAGAEPRERDAVAEAALPGDSYDLAPASSQDLGEDAWRAHIAWGAAKAAAFTRPVAAVLTTNLMDAAPIESAISASGYRPVVWRSASDVESSPVVVFVDLTHPESDGVIRSSTEAGSRVVAFGPHVDDMAMTRARTLGATEAIARSRFFTRVGSWLPPVV